MTDDQINRVSLDSMRLLIPEFVRELSIGRAQIALEQLRRTIAEDESRLIILTTSSPHQHGQPQAAAAAILGQPPRPRPGLESQFRLNGSERTATIVHATRFGAPDPVCGADSMRRLSAALDQELQKCGVRFAQWATERVDPPQSSNPLWCSTFGFRPIGSLDYLSGSVPRSPHLPFDSKQPPAVQFEPLDWDDASQWMRIIDLVDQTYQHTLDCPELAAFRSTEQVLNGYRLADAFAPNLWFKAFDSQAQLIGCLILAVHSQAGGSVSAMDADHASHRSVEIVYMGLVPQSRGSGYGRRLVQQAFDVARDMGADQLLLAVDRRNDPARHIYESAGLRLVIDETVWVKLID